MSRFFGCLLFSCLAFYPCLSASCAFIQYKTPVVGCFCREDNIKFDHHSRAERTRYLQKEAEKLYESKEYDKALDLLSEALDMEENENDVFLLYDRARCHRAMGNKKEAASDFDSVIDIFESKDSNPPMYSDAIIGRMSVSERSEIERLKVLYNLYKENSPHFPKFEDTEYGVKISGLISELRTTAVYDRVVNELSVRNVVKGCKDCPRNEDGSIELHFKKKAYSENDVSWCQDNCDSAAVMASMGCSVCGDPLKVSACIMIVEGLRRSCKYCCWSYYNGSCESQLDNFTPRCQ